MFTKQEMIDTIKLAHANYAHHHLAGSKLVVIKKMGHLLTSEFTAQVKDELLEHFTKST